MCNTKYAISLTKGQHKCTTQSQRRKHVYNINRCAMNCLQNKSQKNSKIEINLFASKDKK